jgi:autotransporter-associated beta strand protein
MGSKTLTLSNASGTFAGILNGSDGALALTSGTQTLSGTNAYNGATTINGGTLALTGEGSIGSSSGLNLAGASGAFDISGTTSGATITSLDGVDGSSVVLGSKALTLANTSGAFAGVLRGSGGSLNLASGSQILSGISTYTGATTINSAALALTGSGSIAASSGLNIANSSGIFDISGTASGATITSLTGVAGSSVLLGDKILTLSNASGTFAGVMSGPGSALALTAGTQVLSGTNTYTGATTINGGTLALTGLGSIVSSSGVNLVGATGKFDISGTADGTTIKSLTGAGGSSVVLGGKMLTLANASGNFDGVMSGSGGALTLNSGTQGLSGINTYTGATTINNATLALTGSGSIAASSGVNISDASGKLDISGTASGATITSLTGIAGSSVVLGSKTLTLSNPSGAFDGILSGTGGAITLTSGRQTLSGINTYTGTTTINSGTLALTGSGSIAASSGVNITNSSGKFDISETNSGATITSLAGAANSSVILGGKTLTLSNSSGTFAGIISGSGGALVLTSGAQTLSGMNTYTGATTINGGALAVNGSISSSNVTVNAGGILGGTGTVGSTVINSAGVLAPGNSIGTITVNGNLTLGSGSTYQIEASPSAADRTNVTGTATLTGSNLQVSFSPGSYLAKQYTLLHAAGLGGTTFSTLSSENLPSGFKSSLSYTTTDVILNLLGALDATGMGANQRSLANSLNKFFNSGGTLTPAFVPVFGLNGTNLGSALSLLSGEAATGAQQSSFQLTNHFLGLMLAPSIGGRSKRLESLNKPKTPAIRSSVESPQRSTQGAGFEQRWSLWGSAFGGYNKMDGDAAAGTSSLIGRDYGFAAGMDYRATPNTVFGFAMADAATNWGLAGGMGGGQSKAIQTGIYGKANLGHTYLAGAFAFTNHWMTVDRNSYAGSRLKTEFEAQNYSGHIEGGYRFAKKSSLGITPYAALQLQSFHTPSYIERDLDNGGYALNYLAHGAMPMRYETGARFDIEMQLDNEMEIGLHARTAWAHDWKNNSWLNPEFQALPDSSFIVNGAASAKNLGIGSIGAQLYLTPALSIAAKVNGEFSERSKTYSAEITLGCAW